MAFFSAILRDAWCIVGFYRMPKDSSTLHTQYIISVPRPRGLRGCVAAHSAFLLRFALQTEIKSVEISASCFPLCSHGYHQYIYLMSLEIASQTSGPKKSAPDSGVPLASTSAS